jgi:hypothetical protein
MKQRRVRGEWEESGGATREARGTGGRECSASGEDTVWGKFPASLHPAVAWS